MPLNAPTTWGRTDWKGTGVYGPIMQEINRLRRQIEGMRWIGPGGNVQVFGDRIEISGHKGPWHMLSFWYSQSGADVTIRAGNLRILGSKNIAVAETNLTLTGSPEWIYVKHVRTSDTATIEHSVSEPETTPTTLNYPLYKFTFDTTIQAYRLADQGIKHVGDINLDTPLGA